MERNSLADDAAIGALTYALVGGEEITETAEYQESLTNAFLNLSHHLGDVSGQEMTDYINDPAFLLKLQDSIPPDADIAADQIIKDLSARIDQVNAPIPEPKPRQPENNASISTVIPGLKPF
ncbi:MAG: hypothetical protein KDJ75_10440 [Alphaproteobacteria bacterium]|nr:hypothetical protein [Alphaproteobacteria bacterium]